VQELAKGNQEKRTNKDFKTNTPQRKAHQEALGKTTISTIRVLHIRQHSKIKSNLRTWPLKLLLKLLPITMI